VKGELLAAARNQTGLRGAVLIFRFSIERNYDQETRRPGDLPKIFSYIKKMKGIEAKEPIILMIAMKVYFGQACPCRPEAVKI